MMVCLLGLFRTERLAREMSAVTRVMDILKQRSSTLQDKRYNITGHALLKPFFFLLPSFKLVFQKIKESFLHHVCHLLDNKTFKNRQPLV